MDIEGGYVLQNIFHPWNELERTSGTGLYRWARAKASTGCHILIEGALFETNVDVSYGVSWPSGLAYRTQVLVLATECGFESQPWHLCPWARHLIIIASLHPGVKWVPVRAELVDEHRPYMRCNGSNWAEMVQEWCMSLKSRGNNAPWAPLSWWIRALYKSI